MPRSLESSERDESSRDFRSLGPCARCGEDRLLASELTVSSLAFLARSDTFILCGCGERRVRWPR
ncbi:MAG: hypothetical protein ACREMQ_14575 [Longimicrobiales bacterium]